MISQSPRAAWTLLSCVVLSLIFLSPATAESWTDLRGTRTIEAELVGLWDESAILQLSNGRRISVKLSSLRSESRIQARELGRQLSQRKDQRSKEIQSLRDAKSAPAPNPLPLPPPTAAPYQPFTEDLPADQFVTQIHRNIANGHLVTLYDALPPSYRNDVDEMARLFAQKLDVASIEEMTELVRKVGDLVVTRQNWLFSSPRFKSLPEQDAEEAKESLLAIAGLARSSLAPESFDLKDLQTQPFGEWLRQWNTTTAPAIAEVMALTDSSSQLEATIESTQDDVVTVRLGVSGRSEAYKKIQGYWFPASRADRWESDVTAWKESIEKMPSGRTPPIFGAVVSLLRGSLLPLEKATSADEFHQSLEKLIAPFLALSGNLPTQFGGPGSGPRVPRGSDGRPQGVGFESQYDPIQ